MVQLSHPYMTTGKTIALTRQAFVRKVISLLFNKLSRFVTAFIARSKCLLISWLQPPSTWLQSPSTVILELKKIKSVTVSIISPSICHEVMGSDIIIFVFWMLSFKPTFKCPGGLLITATLRPFPGVGSAERNSKHSGLLGSQKQREIFHMPFKEFSKKYKTQIFTTGQDALHP